MFSTRVEGGGGPYGCKLPDFRDPYGCELADFRGPCAPDVWQLAASERT